MLEIVRKVLEVVRKGAGGSEWCAMCDMGAGGHAVHALRYAIFWMLFAVLYAALYAGGRGWRAPIARGARVMRYVWELRALRAVSAGSYAPYAGGREGRAACAVYYSSMEGVRCMLEAKGMRSRCWRVYD